MSAARWRVASCTPDDENPWKVKSSGSAAARSSPQLARRLASRPSERSHGVPVTRCRESRNSGLLFLVIFVYQSIAGFARRFVLRHFLPSACQQQIVRLYEPIIVVHVIPAPELRKLLVKVV